MSSLLALRSFYPTDPLVQDILLRLSALHQVGKSVQFCWTPSHVGITGNELADAAARQASSVQSTRRFPLPARDLFPAASREFGHATADISRPRRLSYISSEMTRAGSQTVVFFPLSAQPSSKSLSSP